MVFIGEGKENLFIIFSALVIIITFIYLKVLLLVKLRMNYRRERFQTDMTWGP